MKQAVLYEKKGRLFVRANAQTTTGVWVDDGPCYSELISAAVDLIGNMVVQALEGSRKAIPHPKVFDGINEPLLTAAGVKSWNTFARGTKCVNLEQSSSIKITSTKNLGSSGGFVPIEEAAIELPTTASAEEIGQAVLKALALSA